MTSNLDEIIDKLDLALPRRICQRPLVNDLALSVLAK
jgi:hypothetical protein